MRLLRPTQLLRVTVDQQGKVGVDGQPVGDGPFVGPAPEVPVRRITVLTAPSPALFVSIDQPVSDVGANRTQYKWPPLPQDATVSFHLGPDQSLYGAAGQGGGVVSFGVLIEYLEE